MCFGSNKKSTPQAQVPDPTPIPQPADVAPQVSAEQRRAKIAAMKYGAMGMVKNVGGAQGLTGTGPNLLYTPQATGQKTTLGG